MEDIFCANQSEANLFVFGTEILSKCLSGNRSIHFKNGKYEITQTDFIFSLLKFIDCFPWETNMQGFQW